jgi:GATA-binding protein
MQFTFSIDTPPGSFPATSSSSYTFSGFRTLVPA